MASLHRYRKGVRREHQARQLLRAAGYTVARTAQSRGPFDLVALNNQHVRLVAVKAGTARHTPQERAALADVAAPPCVTKELWTFPDRVPLPQVTVLQASRQVSS